MLIPNAMKQPGTDELLRSERLPEPQLIRTAGPRNLLMVTSV